MTGISRYTTTNMKRCSLAAFLAASFLVSAVSTAQAHDPSESRINITWQEIHYPPVGITEGPRAGQGFMQQARNWLIERLPQFDHEIEEIAIPRIRETIREENLFCSTFLVHTDLRDRMMVFSSAMFEIYPLRFLIAEDAIPAVLPAVSDGSVDLEMVASQNRLSVGLPLGYRFDRELGLSLSHLRDAPMTAQAGELPDLIRLFEADRLDSLMIHDVNVVYHQRDGELTRASKIYPIKNAQPQEVAVSCTRTNRGHKVIAAVNELIGDKENRLLLAGFYAEWLPENMRKEFLAWQRQ
ncbi:hypothetical protein LPB41_27645 [Thalassospira sp. MA62]|nr:hypothetical protein [Thalassospira sp. MA62]